MTVPPGKTASGLDLRSRTHGRLVTAIGLGVTAALVAVAAWAIDPSEVVEALLASEPLWLLPALAALALATFFRALRWRSLFLREMRPPVRPVLASLLIGDLFNNVLPLRAGEAARLFALHARSGISRAHIAATVVLERVFDVALLLLVLFAAVPWLPDVPWLRTVAWLGLAVGATAAAAVVVLAVFGDRPARLALRPLRWLPFLTAERWEGIPVNLTRGLAGLTSFRVGASSLLLTAGAWTAGIISCWVLMFGFDLELGPSAAVLVVVATALGMGVPSAPASLGVFEAATVVALAAFGVPVAQALSYALVLHAVNFLPFVLAGIVVLGAGRRAAHGNLSRMD